ncbi:Fe-S oxidoreductase [Nocardioides scoriae]|uniref:Fe-S oxidoreductase n=1 Tax=Nocardioides scoriae TaxID=642780 RepID=A0A1H1WFK7_9ACTN|nr:heterodisulfide reductase-related iron-sulfur binding cluster [Nocardioides scoriae]SDS95844.1 Fe-S oxidoreductase [Nocardioides scoriae]
MQLFAQIVSIAIAVVGIALFVKAIRQIIATIKIGQPARRTDNPVGRSITLVKESLGHTRMLQWHWVGAGHWFIMTGFGLLFFTLLTAFGQLFDAHFALPLIGHFFLFEWLSELFTVVMLVAIVAFVYYRATRPKERVRGPKGRFWGSTMWQGYFVEMVILGVGLCIVVLRGLEYALLSKGGEHSENATAFHFPFSFWLGELFSGLSTGTIENLVYLVAMLKILISFTWMIVISLRPTMGVAWHRFLAFFNIYFKRHATGRTALGGLAPMTSGGKTIDFEDLEEMDEDTKLGVGAVEDFAWKGILDFSTCTECGRCQSQCPAWNTEKPLSPKLLITALRDHAYAKAPYLNAAEGDRAALLEGDTALAREVERPLVGDTGDDWFYMPDSGAAVIDSDVLWNCTSCGACVQQCPVDIEHVDHIVDMRRYAVLVESNFPSELNGLFKGLENKGNPWNMSPNARLDWAKDLPFEVKVVGEDVESLDEVEWLFWVGCAGAYEDRAKKTTRAVAELLDMAGVDFAVLGNGETCTGDPARRAGNEFVFQGLAAQNAETLKDAKAKKVVSTCAHCFNTLKNEYAAFGVELEVVHHTQLLNRLVREKRLTPVASNGTADKRQVTYHDPCYIGRHNGVYSPPRELLQVIPDATLVEMPRNSERSFCCGAGGARMWMEENTGERINLNRTKEAVETGADQIAVGCPFCRVMLSDGLTNQQSKGEAREEVEVLDVAQMLLASVKGETRPVARSTAGAGAAASGAAAAGGGTATLTREQEEAVEEDTHAEPSAGDATQTADTVTATEDAGPLAKASGGSSLFDEPEMKDAEPASTGGGAASAAASSSLFDLGDDSSSSSASAAPAEAAPAEAAPAEKAPSGGGSLFDLGDDDTDTGTDSGAGSGSGPAPTAKADAGAASTPATEIPQGGSLFDLAEPDDSASPAAEPASEPASEPAGEDPSGDSTTDGHLDRSQDDADTSAREPGVGTPEETAPAAASSRTAVTPATEIPEGGSLFDLAEPEEETVAAAPQLPAGEATSATEEPAAPVGDEPAGEDPAGDSTTDGHLDRSQDDADTSAREPGVGTPEDTAPAATAPAAGATSGSRTAITPASAIPEGGSLFDLAEPEEETVAGSSAAPASEVPTEAAPAQDEAADAQETVVEESDTPASGDQVSSEAEPAATEPAPEPSGATAAATASASASTSGSSPAVSGKYAKGRSMFDLPAASAPAATAATAAPAAAPETAPVAEASTEATTTEAPGETPAESPADAHEPAAEAAPVRSLRDIKAKFAGGGSASEATAATPHDPDVATDTSEAVQAEPRDEVAPAPEAPEDGTAGADDPTDVTGPAEADTTTDDQPARPAGSGEAHQPRTDADVHDAGSLFDL